MNARALPVFAAFLLLSASAVHAQTDPTAPSPLKETMPTWYVIKSDEGTSAPVIDVGSGSILGFLPRGAEFLTFGTSGDLLMISVNRRTAFVPKSAANPKYPLPPPKPEFVISPGGLEKNLARARETAKARREEGLAPRVMATPFGFVPESTPGTGGAAGGGRPGGGDSGGL
jgi:hypothetical protein